jgi:mono/diheme cytochrome c family protein
LEDSSISSMLSESANLVEELNLRKTVLGILMGTSIVLVGAILAPGFSNLAMPDRKLGSLPNSDLPSFQFFSKNIVPILESRCAFACHGISPPEFKSFMSHSESQEGLYFPISLRDGLVPRDRNALVQTFKILSGGQRLHHAEPAEFSPLLRHPLAGEFGGLSHRGIDVFTSSDDPDYLRLKEWVEIEILNRGVIPAPFEPQVKFFKNQVLGVLVRNGCFLPACHGPNAFNELKLIPPLPRTDDPSGISSGFSRSMILENHKRMLGKTVRQANLGGTLELSRLIVKNLPLRKGGVHQRGGNNQFFESLSDPDVKTLLQWLKMEKNALAKKLRSGSSPIPQEKLGVLQGIVFIRGPRHQPTQFFNPDVFWPGSDIYLLKKVKEGWESKAVNLTKDLHPQGDVHIQSLDIRYDSQALVFSMRSSKESGFRLYELDLTAVSGVHPLRKISFGPQKTRDGDLIHHIDPIYIPGPDDLSKTDLAQVGIAFASNAAGQITPSLPWGFVGEADGGTRNEVIDIQRTEAASTFTNKRIYFVSGPSQGEWRKILSHKKDPKSYVGSILTLDRPLKEPLDRKTVYVIENQKGENLPGYDIWSLIPSHNPVSAFDQTASQMTFTSAQERRPSMRTNGEVMFTTLRNIAWQGNKPIFNAAIFRVHAGGFDYHIQGGNRSRYPIHLDSRELPQGLEVRLAMDPRNLSSGGSLLLVDHGFGVHLEPDNPMDDLPFTQETARGQTSSTPRFLAAQLAFLPETGPKAITHTGLSPGGGFRDPYPLPDGTLLVSHVNQPLDHLDPTSAPQWDIYQLRFPTTLQTEDGQAVAPFELNKITTASSPEYAEYSARPLIVRLKEKSRLKQKFAKREDGAKPIRRYGVLRMPPGTPGEIECYDYPLLESFLTQFAPSGPRSFRTHSSADPSRKNRDPSQQARYVRILEQTPLSRTHTTLIHSNIAGKDPFATAMSLGIHLPKRIVAEIPIEEDGSFSARVPTEVPLIVQGLNDLRMAIHSMNRWFYLQPGEKLTFSIPRTIFPLRCAGCHGSLTGSPADGLGQPDLVSAASRVMATWDPELKKHLSPRHGDTNPRLSIDFRKDIQPILDQKCVSCHGRNNRPSANLDLRGWPTKHFSRSYEALHALEDPKSGNYAKKRYINEREALSSESYLMEKLLGRELLASRDLKSPKTPHPKDNPLSQKELLSVIRWIDLGATFKVPSTKEQP